MKTFISLLIPSVLLFLSSCSTTYLSSGGDDVYFTKQTAKVAEPSDNNAGQNYHISTNTKAATEYTNVSGNEKGSETEDYTANQNRTQSDYSEYDTDEQGNTIINNYYYGDNYNLDDYYDYAYSSRIKRFHRYHYSGFGYYHGYYTDMYWYTYDPFYYGVSIYYGYPWWYPSSYYYSPYSVYWGSGWGYGYYPYYSPWYGYGYGYGGYWGGYYNGYWNGFYDGYWYNASDYYYNSYDGTNRYYGSRNYTTSGDGAGRSSNQSFGQRYEQAVNQQVDVTSVRSSAGSLTHETTGTTNENVVISKDRALPSGTAADGSGIVREAATPTTGSETREAAYSRTETAIPVSETATQTSVGERRQEGYTRTETTRPLRERTYTPPVQSRPSQERQFTQPRQVQRPVNQTRPVTTHATPSQGTTNYPRPAESQDARSYEPVKTYSKPTTEPSSSYRQPVNTSPPATKLQTNPQPARSNDQGGSKTYTRPSGSTSQPSTYSRPSNQSRPASSRQESGNYSRPSNTPPSGNYSPSRQAPSSGSRQPSSIPPTSSGRSSYSTPSSSGSSGSSYSSGSYSRSGSSGNSYSSGSSSRSSSSGSSSSSSGSSSRSGSYGGGSSNSGRR